MHPDELRRIALWVSEHPGVGLPDDPATREDYLTMTEFTVEHRPLAELCGWIAIRAYCESIGDQPKLLDAAIESLNDLSAALGAHHQGDLEPGESQNLAGIISWWVSDRFHR